MLQRVPSGDVAGIAYEVGVAFGEQLAESRQLRGGKDLSSAVDEVVDVMHGLGFRTRRDEIEFECGYATTHCPFGTVALENPRVVCSLDRGLVAGLMGTMHKDIEVRGSRTEGREMTTFASPLAKAQAKLAAVLSAVWLPPCGDHDVDGFGV